MADNFPTAYPSLLKTNPVATSRSIFRKQPASLGQLGRATSYTSNGDVFSITRKPNYYQLAAWDEARRKEPLIKQGLEYLVLSIISKLGPYSHPDPMIDDFIQANIDNKIRRWITSFTYTLLWGGFSVSENLYTKKMGPKNIPQLWIEDQVNFHPLQVTLLSNDYGIIKDGDKITSSQFKSGVYVPTPFNSLAAPRKNVEYMGSLVRLPKANRMYATLGGESGNPWGRSLLESILPYHLFKEAFRDMWTTALDRYGTPLVYVKVPPMDTKEMVEEIDGSVRPKTLQEQAKEQMEHLSAESALIFTQISKDQPVELGALTTGNNFSDSFQVAMDMCDLNMLHGMGIPNLLMKDIHSRLGSGGASERQLEMFNSFTGAIFDLVVEAFIDQVIVPLIQFNFDPNKHPKAYISGTLQKKPTRIAELESLTKAIQSFTELGYMNPANDMDFRYVRELVGIPQRPADVIPDGVLPDNRSKRIEVGDAPVPNPAATHNIEANKIVSQERTNEKNLAHQKEITQMNLDNQQKIAATKAQSDQAKATAKSKPKSKPKSQVKKAA